MAEEHHWISQMKRNSEEIANSARSLWAVLRHRTTLGELIEPGRCVSHWVGEPGIYTEGGKVKSRSNWLYMYKPRCLSLRHSLLSSIVSPVQTVLEQVRHGS